MKTRYKSLMVLILFYILGIAGSIAQPRVIKGIVYGSDGKPASGVTVTAHRSNESFFTSFDGAYELKADAKSKYIKFAFHDREEKVDIEGNTSDVIDFGKKAETAVNEVVVTGDLDLRTRAQLVQAGVKEYVETASIFEQFYKQGDYKSALAPWIIVYMKFPKSSDNVYIQGIKMYEDMIGKASETEKDALLNKILEIYDKKIGRAHV